MPPRVSLASLPVDVWAHFDLTQRELAAVAMCCRELRTVADLLLASRGIRLKQLHGRVLEQPRWAMLQSLSLHGIPRRYGKLPHNTSVPPLPLVALPRLRRLRMEHCRLPPGFWKHVFDTSPALVDVSVVCDYFLANYAEDVHHAADLVEHGAKQLRRLDMEGGWLVMYPTPVPTSFHEVQQATARVYRMPAAPSATLTHFRMANQQAPLPVDAPLDTLEIHEPHQPPFVAPRMGPLSKASTAKLVWKCACSAMDAIMLAGFTGLRSLDILVDAASTSERLSKCLDTLQHLPRGLQRLSLRLDTWMLRTYYHDIRWPSSLRHLDDLRELVIDMLFPPATAEALLGHWMGAGGSSLRSVRLAFDETAGRGYEEEIDRMLVYEEADPEDERIAELRDRWHAATAPLQCARLVEWLDAHPRVTVAVRNMPQIACAHDRLELA